jgi:hypothetical protein
MLEVDMHRAARRNRHVLAATLWLLLCFGLVLGRSERFLREGR